MSAAPLIKAEAKRLLKEGNVDVIAFVQLCAKHHLLVLARLGPWNHAELRNGGFPDWLVKQLPASALRSNDPAYLAAVQPYWHQLRQQTARSRARRGAAIPHFLRPARHKRRLPR